MKEDFITMLNVFMEYAYYSLKKYEEPIVCKSGILAITSIICSFNKLFLPYVSMTLSLLFEILKEENLNRSVKLLAISAIGDICMNIPETISQNILSIVQILFSASGVAITTSQHVEDVNI
jgi:importin subunit beta-1